MAQSYAIHRENAMPLPTDLKNYRAEDDAFSLIPPHTAGLALLALLGIVCILEPAFR